MMKSSSSFNIQELSACGLTAELSGDGMWTGRIVCRDGRGWGWVSSCLMAHQHNTDYSLPLKNGRMLGMIYFKSNEYNITNNHNDKVKII